MISLKNVSKSFGRNQVLKSISVDFEKGLTNLIIGQSGSGKTVLLKSIVGLLEADSGDIFFNDRNFTKLNTRERRKIRKEIGMVFQGGALFNSSTVEENVMFPLEMFSDMNAEERREQANICLKRVNIINANHKFPSEISGGMQKRVAIARAIALNPRYLFCDEPNSGLDPKTSIVIDNLIREITHEYDITTVVNTHDMNSVMEIGDKVVYIHKGQKQWEGSKLNILDATDDYLNSFVFASKIFKKFKSS